MATYFLERLFARQADFDARCGMCSQLILGYHGSRRGGRGQLLTEHPEPAHPLDTLDVIVKVDGEWVHADCAEDHGREVIRSAERRTWGAEDGEA